MAITAADPRSRPDNLEEKYGGDDSFARRCAEDEVRRNAVVDDSIRWARVAEQVLAAVSS